MAPVPLERFAPAPSIAVGDAVDPDCKLDGTITTSLTEVVEAKAEAELALLRKLSWMSDGL